MSQANPSQGVLLLREPGSDPAQMCLLNRSLAEEGYTVCEPTLPESGWRNWIYEARAACCELKKRCGAVYVLGLSTGALLALLLAEEYSLEGLICLSAPMRLQPQAAWERFCGRSGLSTGAGAAHLRQLAGRGLFAVTCPTLIVHSVDDPLARASGAHRICQEVSAPTRQMIWLHRSGHLVTLGPERALLLSAVLSFLQHCA